MQAINEKILDYKPKELQLELAGTVESLKVLAQVMNEGRIRPGRWPYAKRTQRVLEHKIVILRKLIHGKTIKA